MTQLLIRLFIKDSENTKDQRVRTKYGYLGSVTGIVLNICLFIGKLIAGLVSGAISVMADAFNNLSDAGSSILNLFGFKIAAAPADREHPFGHGRMEYVCGLIISFIIMLMGFELGKSSVTKIFKPDEVNFSSLTLGILIASVLVKLWMGLFNRKLGNAINSTSMKAAATDSISDCISTTAVIIAMLITMFTGVNIDGYIGTAVAIFIFYSGINTFRDSLTPLLGSRPDREFVQEIADFVESYPLIAGVHDLIIHDYGVGNLIISMHAEVPSKTDFNKAHELIDHIEEDMKAKYKCLVSIHMDPVDVDDEHTVKTKASVIKIVKEINPVLTIHDFRMTQGENRENLIFDIVVPYDFKLSDDELANLISDSLHLLNPKFYAVINVDKDYA